MNLNDKIALVTGAGRGIGRRIALALGCEGVGVALAARTESQLRAVREEIISEGGRAECFCLDVSDEESIKTVIEGVVKWAGRLDILVNNAAIGIFGPLEETSVDDWDLTMAVNARAPFIACREAIPHLRKAERGFIVNISSVIGVKGYANQSAYTASKHALMGMSRALAREVHNEGISVHTICPGGVNTEFIRNARPDLEPDVLIDPEEIAKAVVFLITRGGNSVVDELHLRRDASVPFA
jgi:3-oxoacyl-[acyl-carrier protein] reductase